MTDMNREEKITKLCEKVMVTREEADAALAASNDDILDAVLYLESLGRIRTPKAAVVTEETTYYDEPVREQAAPKKSHKSESFGEALGRFCKWCVKMIKAGCDNDFTIARNGEKIVSIPLIIPVLLLIPFFWLEAILLIVGLFLGCSYSLTGPAFDKDSKANSVSRKASEKAEKFRNDFNRGFDNYN